MPAFDYKKWYKENGKALNEKRKARYNSDPVHKSHILDANRDSRRRKRAVELVERSHERAAMKCKPGPKWKQVTIEIAGTPTEAVTIGALASILKRSKLGVRLLERRGVIPATPLRNKARERLYTLAMVEDIRKLLDSKGMLVRKKVAVMPECVVVAVKLADGTMTDLPVFRIGVLAKAVGRSTITLEQMERRGAIPATPLKLPPNRRVFTQEQIEVIRSAFDRRGGDLRSGHDKDKLYGEILQGWTDLNLIGASVVVSAPDKE